MYKKVEAEPQQIILPIIIKGVDVKDPAPAPVPYPVDPKPYTGDYKY